MNSKSLVNLLGTVLVYLVLAGVLYLLPVSALGPTGDQDQAVFLLGFRHNALVALAASFAAAVLWFAAGEYLVSAWSPVRTWLLVWSALFAVVLAVAVYCAFSGPRGGSADPVNYPVALWYLVFGPLAYYGDTVLFSPTNAQYTIWPAARVRRGW